MSHETPITQGGAPSAPDPPVIETLAITHRVFGWAAAAAERRRATCLEPCHFLVALQGLNHHLHSNSILGDLGGDMAVGGSAWPSSAEAQARLLPRTPKVWDSDTLPLSRGMAWRLRKLTADPSTLTLKGLVDWVAVCHTGKPAVWRKVEVAPASTPDPVHPLIRCTRNAQRLEAHIRSKILGQGDAARAMAEAYVQSHLFQGKKGPSILTFLGPPGTGKTLAARAFAEGLSLIDGEGAWHFCGFSLTQGELNLPRLQMMLQEHPHSVVVLDEIEKAASATLAGLLPILGGDFMGGFGPAVDSCQAWFIVTSNLGAEFLDADGSSAQGGMQQDPFDILRNAKQRSRRWDREAMPVLSPEFVSRLAQGRAVIFRRPAAHHFLALADPSSHP